MHDHELIIMGTLLLLLEPPHKENSTNSPLICAMVAAVAAHGIPAERRKQVWQCLHCRAPLDSMPEYLRCRACGKQYPVVCGIPLLVKEPLSFLQSELTSLRQAQRNSTGRRDLLDKLAAEARLTSPSRERHRNVLAAEIARADTFLSLLEPAARVLEQLGEAVGPSGAQRSGWTFDSLFPYLLRDWTDTSEFRAISSLMNGALKQAFPDTSGKSVVVAGCGAGGLLGELSGSLNLAVVQGFDLTLPVLAAARHLLDGGSLELAMPKCIHPAGMISLSREHGAQASTHSEVLVMDAFDTAFAESSVDCVITSFLIDLVPNPEHLASEIHRILVDDGIWINYGPSGPLNAVWRFDEAECGAFFESAGFTLVQAEAHRGTYLDLSRDCPSWSFRSQMCYLTSGRKSTRGPIVQQPQAGWRSAVAAPADIARVIPQHFPGATLIYRQTLGIDQTGTILVRHERLPGSVESLEIANDVVRMVTLVDGKRTVRQIAETLNATEPILPIDQTIRAFARFFDDGLLSWRYSIE